MPKNQPRSNHVDFLGNKFKTLKCPKCKETYEVMQWETKRTCARCSNNVESEDNEIDI